MYLLSEERTRLADLGYYSFLGLGSTADNLHREVSMLGVAEHERAVLEYQVFFEETLNVEAQSVHRRAIQRDGLWGPVCHRELAKARCMVADKFTVEEAAQQGNWPTDCRQDLTTSYRPGMTLNGLDGEQGIKDMINQSLRQWEEVIDMDVTLKDSSEYPNTHVYIKAAVLGGSVLADQYLAINQCSYRSQGRMDSNRRWNHEFATAVRSHEDGHAWGLPHSRSQADVMYPRITQRAIETSGVPSSGDIRAMVNIGYKKREGSPPTDPTPPTTTAEVIVKRRGEEDIIIYGVEF